MSETMTPICDLIEELMSGGLSPSMSLTSARKIEAKLAETAKSSGSAPDQRERWRLKKAAQRNRKRGLSPGTNPDPILTKTPVIVGVVKKKEPRCPHVPGDTDDWPVDFLDQFWAAFPPYRRQAKAKVGQKLERIRATKKVTWSTLHGGVLKFAATHPGEYAPAPMVWLNDGRWDREYGSNGGGLNGKAQGAGDHSKAGFSAIAARIRHGARSSHDARPAPEDLEPVNRR